MKRSTQILIALSVVLLSACGGGGKSKIDEIRAQSTITPADPYDLWQSNHGVGPVKEFALETTINQELVAQGSEIFQAKCTACHKTEKKFIGPSPAGILSRRTPAWVMNMILNPDVMIQQDPIAKKLIMEYNGSPMANQSLTEAEARAVLEYFRTL